MPKVRKGEKRKKYLERCIPEVMKEGRDQRAAVGKCEGMYNDKWGLSNVFIQLSANDSEVIADSHDGLTYWKEVAHVGTFKKGDQTYSLDTPLLNHWHKTFNAMRKNGSVDHLPLPVEHTKDPEKKRGKILEFARKPNKKGQDALYAKVQFRDSEAAKLRFSGVSVFSPSETFDGYGRTYSRPIEHVAITDYPVIPDLEPYSIALSFVPAGDGDTHRLVVSNPLLADATRRANEAMALSFPPQQNKNGDDGSDKRTPDQPNVPPQNQAQQPVAGAKMTLRDLATQLGIDPSINDEQQLLLAISNAMAQLKARAQAPMPPRGQPMQGQPYAHPNTGQFPGAYRQQGGGQQGPMPGTYGPPAMHTGRPPVAMAFDESKHPRGKKGTHEGGKFVVGYSADGYHVKHTKTGKKYGRNFSAKYEAEEHADTLNKGKKEGGKFVESGGGSGRLSIEGDEQGERTREFIRSFHKPNQDAHESSARANAMSHKVLNGQWTDHVAHHEASLAHAKAAALHRREGNEQEAREHDKKANAHRGISDNMRRRSQLSMSLTGLLEDDLIMAMDKGQFKQLKKTLKKAVKKSSMGKSGYKGDNDLNGFNDESHFGQEEIAGSDEDDTYKDEDNDAFYNGCDNDEENEETMSGKGKKDHTLSLSLQHIKLIQNSRAGVIDALQQQRLCSAAVAKQLKKDFVDTETVAFSQGGDDGFDYVVETLKRNGRVIPGPRTGPQGELQPDGAIALSNGQEYNPLMADAEARAKNAK